MTARYRLPAFCPLCHWKPAVRAYPELVAMARSLDPDTPLFSVKCERSGCGHFYPITALDLQGAVEVRAA